MPTDAPSGGVPQVPADGSIIGDGTGGLDGFDLSMCTRQHFEGSLDDVSSLAFAASTMLRAASDKLGGIIDEASRLT